MIVKCNGYIIHIMLNDTATGWHAFRFSPFSFASLDFSRFAFAEYLS